jgi:hypothetical protein
LQKKKQKNSFLLGDLASPLRGPQYEDVFCCFFSKKKRLPYLACLPQAKPLKPRSMLAPLHHRHDTSP